MSEHSPESIIGDLPERQAAIEESGKFPPTGPAVATHTVAVVTGNLSDAEAEAEGDDVLKGEALQERAAELDIQGRSSMTADELRAAVADAEAGQS